MFCLAILFFSLFATVNSSANPTQSNYIKKIQIENNGKKYINPYAFSEMNFTMETLNVQDFIFTVRIMEWPSSVTLREPIEQVQEAVIPSNFETCEDSENCDFLKGENGVIFGSKGTIEFTMANLDKEKEFQLLHSFGYFSPIFTLNDSFVCSKYSTKITFNNLGYIVFKRDGEKIGIETGSLTHENLPILKESNVQFYFYNNFIYCTFFDLQNHFQLHTFKLSDGNGENVLSIKIDYKSSVKRCNGIVKLIVGNGVKLLFPKSITSSTTFNKPIISTPVSNTNKTNKTGIATTKAADKTETTSFPLWAIIVISCVGVVILICGLILLICCLIKKRKNKSPKKSEIVSISEMERRMLAKKQKNKLGVCTNAFSTVLFFLFLFAKFSFREFFLPTKTIL